MLATDTAHAGLYLAFTSDADWSRGLVDRFPLSWAGKLLNAWRTSGKPRQARNLEHLARCTAIRRAEEAGLPADAGDSELRAEADKSARDMVRRLGRVEILAHASTFAPEESKRTGHVARLSMLGQVLEAWHWLDGRGLLAFWPAGKDMPIRSMLKRVCDPAWWRRVLRRAHAQAVESTARAIGLVSKRAGCYASDEACKRRAGQVARNARSLASVEAVNADTGQAYTLADLASRGTANKEIRRNELMTRIAGFELIARDCGHVAAMATMTCPARMHAVRTRPGRTFEVEENPTWDGTRPDEAQRYLAKTWARFRAAADRRGLDLYGFRIAEPNHDGTPHWHAILFFPAVVKSGAAGLDCLLSLLRRYFLADSPDERGADAHRVKVEAIDWARGSAAGYVAKYIAKNIDGAHIERDLYGNEAPAASQRVEAWATTWRIRQFQQIGGAPVGIWRELRRLNTEQAAAAPAVGLMLDAVNVVSNAGELHSDAVKLHTAAHGWATYLELQGGHRVPRRLLRVRLLKEQSGEVGKYGEVMAARAIGVELDEQRSEWVRMPLLRAGGFARNYSARVEVESERSTWIVVPGAAVPAVQGRVLAAGKARRPWSPVNNCTGRHTAGAPVDPARMFAPGVVRHPKTGRYNVWKRKDHGNNDNPANGAER